MRSDLGGKIFDKQSDQKSRIKVTKNDGSQSENKLYIETSEDNKNGFMASLHSKPPQPV